MLYIHTALKPEAQAFVEKYKLKKKKLGQFTLFTNEHISLIISGLGILQTQEALQVFIKTHKLTSDDIFINVGICAASKKYNVGELLEIASVRYRSKTYPLKHPFTDPCITCVDTPISTSKYELVDMESFGFYTSLHDKIKQIYIFKVVSDHFEPQNVNKEDTKKLIFNAIDGINTIIKKATL